MLGKAAKHSCRIILRVFQRHVSHTHANVSKVAVATCTKQSYRKVVRTLSQLPLSVLFMYVNSINAHDPAYTVMPPFAASWTSTSSGCSDVLLIQPPTKLSIEGWNFTVLTSWSLCALVCFSGVPTVILLLETIGTLFTGLGTGARMSPDVYRRYSPAKKRPFHIGASTRATVYVQHSGWLLLDRPHHRKETAQDSRCFLLHLQICMLKSKSYRAI